MNMLACIAFVPQQRSRDAGFGHEGTRSSSNFPVPFENPPEMVNVQQGLERGSEQYLHDQRRLSQPSPWSSLEEKIT